MKALTVLLLCLVAVMAFNECPDNPSGVRACGRKLADLRALVCYRESKRGRRPGSSSHSNNENEIEELWYQELSEMPWLGPHDVAPSWARNKRFPGIVSECCHNCCTLEQIQDYC